MFQQGEELRILPPFLRLGNSALLKLGWGSASIVGAIYQETVVDDLFV